MDSPYWQAAGYGHDFTFQEYECIAYFMRRSRGKVVPSINDRLDMPRAFDSSHFEQLDVRCNNNNLRESKAEVSGELVIMSWAPASLGGLF